MNKILDSIGSNYLISKVKTLLAGKVDKTTTVNGKALSSNITLSASNVSALPISGGTMNGNIIMDNTSATTQKNEPYIEWATTGSNKPYIGFAHDQSDGTFIICSMEKDTTNGAKYYKNGLAIGGGSGNLFWKGVKVATAEDLSSKADLTSPTFKGTPKAPTAAEGTNTTQIATTAFVQTAIASVASAGGGDFEAVDTVFNDDGSIVDTYAGGKTITTVFNDDGSITETQVVNGVTTVRTTTFNNDGSITQTLS